MADVQALRALHYDLATVGSLDAVMAPPYDVIDPEQRSRLAARSPHNVVLVDLPEAPLGGDPYDEAARVLERWRTQGAVVRDERPAMWVLEQDYTGPDGRIQRRRGFLARVRVEDYGSGRIRPHERTHPGPKEDRLRLTRATRANLSPIFSLYDDPEGSALSALDPHVSGEPWGRATDADGTVNRLWRVDDPAALARVNMAMRDTELLIADGHHRYETARAYLQEVGAGGGADYVLMCLVALQDPGLTIFPTHRLLSGLGEASVRERLDTYLSEHFNKGVIERTALRPPDGDGPLELGYFERFTGRALRLTLKDQAIADAALADMPEAYRHLDTAVLEALILKGVLGMTEDDISHLRGLGYSRTDDEALELVRDGQYDAAFFLRPSPVRQVREIAAAGVNMPPKSTFFYPKIPTGLVMNPLDS
jgi:uncharacterized protein (DUF1015 family)